MGKKKVNPRRIPATHADIMRAKHWAQDRAVELCWCVFFSVLRDKEGADAETLRRVWREVNYLTESVVKKFVSVPDLARALKEEAGIDIEHPEDCEV